MELFTAHIVQSKDTITRYTEMQFNLFRRKEKIIFLIFAFCIVIIGLFLLNTNNTLGLIIILIGCLFLTNTNVLAHSAANRVVTMFNGNFPTLHYVFTSNEIIVSSTDKKIKYKNLCRITEDNDYLYLFETPYYCLMVDIHTISGDGGTEKLRKLITDRSGLTFEKPITILNFSLADILHKGKI